MKQSQVSRSRIRSLTPAQRAAELRNKIHYAVRDLQELLTSRRRGDIFLKTGLAAQAYGGRAIRVADAIARAQMDIFWTAVDATNLEAEAV